MTELHQLEQELAYSCARSDIECECNFYSEDDGLYYDIASAGSEWHDYVVRAVRYLDMIGKIKRHQDNHSLIHIRNLTETQQGDTAA